MDYKYKYAKAILSVSLFALLASSVYAQYVYPAVDASDPRTPLYFGLMQSFSDANYDGSGVIPGIDVALDQINDDPYILPGYTLHYTLTDSQVGICGCVHVASESLQIEP